MQTPLSLLKQFRRRWFPSPEQRALQQQENRYFEARKQRYASFLQPGELSFDVGANMGNRIRALLAIGAKVVAVEPQEPCCRHLEKTFGSNITLIQKGLGETAGVKDFHISDAHTLSSFSDEWIASVKEDRFKVHNWNKVVQMEMTTLDQLIAEHGLPAFIKIDVEGYEAEVLKGLHHPIRMISYEYTVPEQTGKVLECLQLIERNGGTIECNYSVGESMEWALDTWLTVEEMNAHAVSEAFIATGFGDIYVRQKA